MTDLFVRTLGAGPPVVMLHGLFGSLDNLGGLARGLASDYRLVMIDLPNHGRSPHTEAMSYPLMADAVVRTLDQYGVKEAAFFGHSMGGKVAMQVALDQPDRVTRLVVGDIAPVKYGNNHGRILDGMTEVAKLAPQDRVGAERILAQYEEDPQILSFLLTNWRRIRGEGGVSDRETWGWRVNLDVIRDQYHEIIAANEQTAGFYDGDVLFLKGGASDYILPEHRAETLALFPNADVRTVAGAGHWLHAEKPQMVERLVKRFLSVGEQ